MKSEVTHWEKTHRFVTSGFFEMDNPVFIYYSVVLLRSVEQNTEK